MKHPARFSDAILPLLDFMLPDEGRVLDPFAGTGRIHELATATRVTVGVEIEPEWAAMHPDTIVGDSTGLSEMFDEASFDAICTSPTYGNRFADHHKARDGSVRRSYTHDLGRQLHVNNSGAMHWGNAYRTLHTTVWAQCHNVLKPGGVLVLSISDHIRKGSPQGVHLWHVGKLGQLGFEIQAMSPIATQRLRHGENGDQRVSHEWVIRFGRRK